jgi:hypothetical protein
LEKFGELTDKESIRQQGIAVGAILRLNHLARFCDEFVGLIEGEFALGGLHDLGGL